MTRVQVIADDGHVTLMERVTAHDLHQDQFRANLAERIAWAAEDADEHEQDEAVSAPSP